MLFIHIYFRPWYYIFLTVISSSHWDTMIIDHPTDQRWGRHKASPLGSPSGEIKKNFVFIKQTIIVYLWIEPYVLKYLQNIGFFLKKKTSEQFLFFQVNRSIQRDFISPIHTTPPSFDWVVGDVASLNRGCELCG